MPIGSTILLFLRGGRYKLVRLSPHLTFPNNRGHEVHVTIVAVQSSGSTKVWRQYEEASVHIQVHTVLHTPYMFQLLQIIEITIDDSLSGTQD